MKINLYLSVNERQGIDALATDKRVDFVKNFIGEEHQATFVGIIEWLRSNPAPFSPKMIITVRVIIPGDISIAVEGSPLSKRRTINLCNLEAGTSIIVQGITDNLRRILAEEALKYTKAVSQCLRLQQQ